MSNKKVRLLCGHNGRPESITALICSEKEGLGYCCEQRFFELYKNTSLIAARLGCSERGVRKHKASPKPCDNCGRCLHRNQAG